MAVKQFKTLPAKCNVISYTINPCFQIKAWSMTEILILEIQFINSMPGHSEGRELFFEAKIRHVHTMCNSGSADEADITASSKCWII